MISVYLLLDFIHFALGSALPVSPGGLSGSPPFCLTNLSNRLS